MLHNECRIVLILLEDLLILVSALFHEHFEAVDVLIQLVHAFS